MKDQTAMCRRAAFTALLALTLMCPAVADAPDGADADGPKAMMPEGGISGSLVIAGGGGTPEAAREAFIELAGGGDDAVIVVIPTASLRADDDDAHSRFVEPWLNRGVQSVTLLHTRDRDEADSEAFVKPLTRATGVWFGGGAQSRITRVYHDTRTHRELQSLLERGGVIGGTSAGAAIMSDPMIARGNPEPELAVGLGFLPGIIVDQHAEERDRLPRLRNALAQSPNFFGIAINEGTAIIVEKDRARVVGRSNVTVMLPPRNGQPSNEQRLPAGAEIDLASLSRAAASLADQVRSDISGTSSKR